ncbi:MAG: Uma2 family endonuclease, partial [Acidobacteria bacterium]|nr:Uma2 family endonuclease [Acidobacteriota bacterium]
MASTAVLTSRAEYDARTEAGERLEFDDGQVIEMPNNDSLHDGIKARLLGELHRQLPEEVVAGNEMAFELVKDRVRIPDIAVCITPRPELAGVRFQGAPELAVEIVSPSESAYDLHAKIQLYLENGAQAVWVVWPDTRQVDIHQAGKPTRHL